MNTKKFSLHSDKAVWERKTYLVDVPEFVAVDPQTLGFFMRSLLQELERNPKAAEQMIAGTSIVTMDDPEGYDEGLLCDQTSWEEVEA